MSLFSEIILLSKLLYICIYIYIYIYIHTYIYIYVYVYIVKLLLYDIISFIFYIVELQLLRTFQFLYYIFGNVELENWKNILIFQRSQTFVYTCRKIVTFCFRFAISRRCEDSRRVANTSSGRNGRNFGNSTSRDVEARGKQSKDNRVQLAHEI